MQFPIKPARPLLSPVAPLTLALLAIMGSPVSAQTNPGAGTLLQQVRPEVPPTPSASSTGLTIEDKDGAKLPPSAPFPIKRITITGNQAFDSATLHALVADAEGKTLALPDLGQLAARITEHYRTNGYPLARGIIPAQTIVDGAVAIQVIEARYGSVGLNNHSKVNDSLLQATLSPLQGGQAITQAEMDRSLLLLSDIPGVAVTASLKPGAQVGESDLQVQANATPAVVGRAVLDNYGNRYIGRERLSGMVSVHNPMGHGDTFSASAMSSGGGMNYGRLSYDTLLNGNGSRLGGSYSALNYKLGNSLASLQAKGTADVLSLWGRHPLLRSRSTNLNAQVQYDQLQLRDRVDSTATRTDRHLNNWTVGLTGDMRDVLGEGSVNAWSVSWTGGKVGFDNAAAQSSDASTAGTQGSFSKFNANLNHLQGLSQRGSLYLSLAGQWARKNLDASQKLAVGGPSSVRAYDVGAVSGDSVYLGSVEYQHDLGLAWGGQWQATVFFDSARVKVNEKTWTTGANYGTLSGVGAGVNWRGAGMWSGRAFVATPVGSQPTELIGSKKSARAWMEVGLGF